MPDDADVLSANAAFYDAFRSEDLAGMEALWSQHAPVACIHPGWPVLIGRIHVLASWREIFGSGGPAIRCAGARAHVFGDVALVTCDEIIAGGRLVATNVFVREDGGWRMVHHHAGPLGAPIDADAAPRKVGLN